MATPSHITKIFHLQLHKQNAMSWNHSRYSNSNHMKVVQKEFKKNPITSLFTQMKALDCDPTTNSNKNILSTITNVCVVSSSLEIIIMLCEFLKECKYLTK